MMIDVSEPRNGRVVEYFRVRSEEAPQVRMVNLSDHVQYQLPSDQFDTHPFRVLSELPGGES